jgi:phosphoglycolate phosphatase-like HAD superfamily hydrolase
MYNYNNVDGVVFMKYKYVVFDFDGTLADTEDMVFTIYLDLADKFKLKKVSKDELYKLKKLSAFEAIDHLDIKKWDLPGLLRRGRKVLHGMIENIDLCKDNMKDVLKEMESNNIMVGVLTSNSKKNVFKFINKHDLDMFTFIENTGLRGKEKKLLKLMAKYGMNKDEVLYVGDEIRDVKAMKHIGIDIAAVDWGYNHKESLEELEPDYLISNPETLIEICFGNGDENE